MIKNIEYLFWILLMCISFYSCEDKKISIKLDNKVIQELNMPISQELFNTHFHKYSNTVGGGRSDEVLFLPYDSEYESLVLKTVDNKVVGAHLSSSNLRNLGLEIVTGKQSFKINDIVASSYNHYFDGILISVDLCDSIKNVSLLNLNEISEIRY